MPVAFLAALLTGAWAGVPAAAPGLAYAQLEAFSADQGRRTDVPASVSEVSPLARAREPAPAKIKPASKSRLGEPIGFSVGFMIAESPALAVMQVPYIGEPLGAILFVALLPVALILGGLGWFIGRLLS